MPDISDRSAPITTLSQDSNVPAQQTSREGPSMDVPPAAAALPPAVLAARKATASHAAGGDTRERAYPEPLCAEDHLATSAQCAATRALLCAETPRKVADIAVTLIHDLGGAVVPARLAETGSSIAVDVSFGLSEPLLPWADPVSLAAMRLTTVLTDFVEDARLVLSRLQGDAQRHQEATRDVLTGLLTRRAWMRRLSQAGPGDAVCLIDLDHFKAVNDSYGHDMGDITLRAVGELLVRAFRDVDVCGRYGGDELVCLTRGLPAPALVVRCEQAASQWRQARPAAAAAVTFSIGVADVGEDGGRAALQRADRAMYRAKSGGRDRVVLAAPEDDDLQAAL